ncbi:MAG: ABC transporter ATP-binding protein [Flavobacteriales bacterium]
MLKVNNITYKYNPGELITFPDFVLTKGEHALMLGQSGCGKTTLLHLIAGMLSPDSGSVEIDGTEIGNLSPAEKDWFRGRNIGIVFQKPYFIQAISIEENLALASALGRKSIDSAFINHLLGILGIKHKAKSKPNQLSQGEQQRATIARALVNKPKLILADEPTSALDDHNCNMVVELLKAQAKEHNSTLIVVTHDNRLKEVFSKRIEL